MAGKRGRPSKYTPALGAGICEELAKGRSLRAICKPDEMPAESTVRDWVRQDIGGFSAQYAIARDLGLDAMAEETLEIADDGTNDTYVDDEGRERVNGDVIQRSRLRVDTRKWFLSKLAPKRYGEKQQHEVTGPQGGPVEHVLTVRFVEGQPST